MEKVPTCVCVLKYHTDVYKIYLYTENNYEAGLTGEYACEMPMVAGKSTLVTMGAVKRAA